MCDVLCLSQYIVFPILFLVANQQNQMVWELDLCGMARVDLNAW